MDTLERIVSLPTKIRQITGLAGTTTVDKETSAFLEDIENSTEDGRELSGLTPAEVKRVEQIFWEHFA